MAKYIPLDAVLAEIENIIADENESIKSFEHGKNVSEVQCSNARIGVLTHLRSLLDSLEVKEVDLEKETKKWWKERLHLNPENQLWMDAHQSIVFAKHFFEFGLNASNPLTWEDVKEICVQSVLVEIDLGGKISDERHYTEVLKRFKAQKGK